MELIKAIKMKKAFINLFNIYAHELSQYNPWIGSQIDRDGNYLSEDVRQYLNHRDNKAYCITEDKRPIGFVVFSYSDNGNESTCYISEIFLLHTSRKRGIAERICKDFWHRHSGRCILHVLKSNVSATTYWEKLIRSCGYIYVRHDYGEQMWSYEFKLD